MYYQKISISVVYSLAIFLDDISQLCGGSMDLLHCSRPRFPKGAGRNRMLSSALSSGIKIYVRILINK